MEEDKQKALKLYRQAADGGYARAQCNLGFFYYKGIAVEENDDEAARWFAAAAKQGYPRAQFLLGECCEHGFGVQQDTAKALELYQKAVDGGYKRAEEALKRMQETAPAAVKPKVQETKQKKRRGLFGFFKK